MDTENNPWMDRIQRHERMKCRMDFMRAISQGGSWLIDWDAVNEKSWGKKRAAEIKAEEARSPWFQSKEQHGDSDGLSAQQHDQSGDTHQ